MSHHPALREPLAVTRPEFNLLRRVLHGSIANGVEAWTLSSGTATPSTDARRLRGLRALVRTGAVEVFAGIEMGWSPSMWTARLTCLGANAVYRFDGGAGPAAHTDCPVDPSGSWLTGGRCSACRQQRPLDLAAHLERIDALSEDEAATQRRAPGLYCVEHGWVRSADVRSDKVCRLPGTSFHDGGLDRVWLPQ